MFLGYTILLSSHSIRVLRQMPATVLLKYENRLDAVSVASGKASTCTYKTRGHKTLTLNVPAGR